MHTCRPGIDASPTTIGHQAPVDAHLELADSGIFLVIDIMRGADATHKWKLLANMAQGMMLQNLLGIDSATCAIQPMRTNPAWGKDVGP